MSFLLTVALLLQLTTSHVCNVAEPKIDLSVGDDPIVYLPPPINVTCDEGLDGCGKVLARAVSEGRYCDEPQANSTGVYVYDSAQLFCVKQELCDELIGANNDKNCVSILDVQYWAYNYAAVSCQDENATPDGCYLQRVDLFVTCSKEEEDLDEDTDEPDCTVASDAVTDYISGMYECWNDEYPKWDKFFVCNEDGVLIQQQQENCLNSEGKFQKGKAYGNNQECKFRKTCTKDVMEIVTKFGECSCQAALDYKVPGALQRAFTDQFYNRMCNFNIFCGATAEGDLKFIVELVFDVVKATFPLPPLEEGEVLTETKLKGFCDVISGFLDYDSSLVCCRVKGQEGCEDFLEGKEDDETAESRRRVLLQTTEEPEGNAIEMLMRTNGMEQSQEVKQILTADGDALAPAFQEVEEKYNITGVTIDKNSVESESVTAPVEDKAMTPSTSTTTKKPETSDVDGIMFGLSVFIAVFAAFLG